MITACILIRNCVKLMLFAFLQMVQRFLKAFLLLHDSLSSSCAITGYILVTFILNPAIHYYHCFIDNQHLFRFLPIPFSLSFPFCIIVLPIQVIRLLPREFPLVFLLVQVFWHILSISFVKDSFSCIFRILSKWLFLWTHWKQCFVVIWLPLILFSCWRTG